MGHCAAGAVGQRGAASAVDDVHVAGGVHRHPLRQKDAAQRQRGLGLVSRLPRMPTLR
jgi:hypothetical protein